MSTHTAAIFRFGLSFVNVARAHLTKTSQKDDTSMHTIKDAWKPEKGFENVFIKFISLNKFSG